MNSLLTAPAPSFDAPLDMLRACHERILTQCRTLEKIQDHLATQGCDNPVRQAAQAILRYFDTAGRHHHDDEERALFPALQSCAHAEANDLIARLLAEHDAMNRAWTTLRPQLVALTTDDAAALNPSDVHHFTQVYREHIALENTQLLPLAAYLLTPLQQQKIGQDMAFRRGIEPVFKKLPL